MPERIAVRREGRSDYEDLVFADPSFFRVFDLPLAAGSKQALSRPEDIVLTQATARKYFGEAPALGRPLTLTVEGAPRTYRVAAVLRDLPANTHLQFAAVAPLDEALFPDSEFESWNNIFLYTYVRIPRAADREGVQAELDRFVDRHGGELGPKPTEVTRLELQALPGIHFADLDVNDAFQPGADRVFILTLGLVGLTTLFIAAVNYVNLSTARAGLRAREVALRKVLGATQRALVLQFLTESLAMAALAALLGLALAELALPHANAILGVELELTYLGPGGLVPLLAGLVLAIGLGAGLYPALVLSRFQPASVLSGSKAPGGGRMGSRVREGLVALQFAISIAMVVCTAVIWGQTTYIRNANLGYEREGLIIVQGLDKVSERIVPLDRAFRQTPGVVSATLSTRSPGDNEVLTTTVQRPGRNEEAELPYERTGPDYFRTYGIRLVAGRDFSPGARLDDLAGKKMDEVRQRGLNVIINQRAARTLGFSDLRQAVGAPIRFSSIPATVVGVAADARFGSPRENVSPVVYLRDTDSGRFAIIRHRETRRSCATGCRPSGAPTCPTRPSRLRPSSRR
jgi:putative ABC transport system permease protein